MEGFFQTKLLSCLSHKVCHHLSSPILLPKFTNADQNKIHPLASWLGPRPRLKLIKFIYKTKDY